MILKPETGPVSGPIDRSATPPAPGRLRQCLPLAIRMSTSLVLCFGLMGCGGNSLSLDVAASIIMVADAKHCDAELLFKNKARNIVGQTLNGSESNSVMSYLNSNFIAGVVPGDPVFNHSSTKSSQGEFGSIETFDYKGPDGWSLIYSTETTQIPFNGQVTALKNVWACMSTESSINVLDITIDKETGKNATVIYQKIEQPTIIATKLNAASIFSLLNHDAFNIHSERQYQATLRYLDQTGWQVISSSSNM